MQRAVKPPKAVNHNGIRFAQVSQWRPSKALIARCNSALPDLAQERAVVLDVEVADVEQSPGCVEAAVVGAAIDHDRHVQPELPAGGVADGEVVDRGEVPGRGPGVAKAGSGGFVVVQEQLGLVGA
jgi:hypothetical protein